MGLGVAIRNVMENKEVITILHKLGYIISYEKLTHYETDLVLKYHGMQHNSLVLPVTIEKYYFSTFVCDKNDHCKETLSLVWNHILPMAL